MSADYPAPQSVENPTVDVFHDDCTHGSETLTGTAYLISNEDEWRYVVATSAMKDKTLVLINDIEFTEPVASLPSFTGKIYGNGYKFINFTQSGDKAQGLIAVAGTNCLLNYVQMKLSNIESTAGNVGCLIGSASAWWQRMDICGCSISYSTITSSSSNIGGVVGYGAANLYITASTIDHVYIKGKGREVGGMVGFSDWDVSAVFISHAAVNCCEVYSSSGGIGGVCGDTEGWMTKYVDVTVKDCKIWAESNGNIGGIVGYSDSGGYVYNGLRVENCTLLSKGSIGNGIGGLKGRWGSYTNMQGEISWVNYTWIGGENALGKIGSFFGPDNNNIGPSEPQHNMVYGSAANCDAGGVDNSFDRITTLEEAIADGVGSVIDKEHLIAGKDYGYNPRYLTYDGNGATSGSVPPTQIYTAGSTVTVAEPGTLVKEGLVFNGWRFGSTSDELMKPGQTFTINEDITLYADWGYVVTYNGNNETSGSVPPTQIYTAGSTVIIAEPGNLVRDGFVFNGWRDGSTTGGLKKPGQTFTINANVTLYADWRYVNLTYDGNGATSGFVPPTQAYAVGSTVIIAEPGNLVRDGFVFNGWRVGSTTGELKKPGQTFTINEDITLYADWITPKSQPQSSRSRETGMTVILTATPTPIPTAEPTVTPTVVPTPVPTPMSPAPVFGLIAGLGAAAILLRLRR